MYINQCEFRGTGKLYTKHPARNVLVTKRKKQQKQEDIKYKYTDVDSIFVVLKFIENEVEQGIDAILIGEKLYTYIIYI